MKAESRQRKLTERLRLMAARRVPGWNYSLHAIASFCGCSYQRIWQIEQAAILKLRRRMQPEGRELGHAMEMPKPVYRGRRVVPAVKQRYVPRVHLPKPGEIPLKQFKLAEAARLGVAVHRVETWLSRGKYPGLKFRRVNSRVVFVKQKDARS